MGNAVTLPLWLFLLLVVLACWWLLDRLLVPSVRWILRGRVNRAIEDLNSRLQLRLQPFKLTKRAVLIDRLTFDPKVLQAVEDHAQETGTPRQVAVDAVRRYAQEIVPAFNAYLYLRLGYWISRRVAQLLYRVRLGSTDEAALREVDREATVVFVMNHRSNMDYVLVSYLVAERAALSYAVGEWARIWPLQTLIRSMGAYFVRRNSRNALYRKVLERYVHMATAAGVTQAVFPEGGLTRDGALRSPKLGLLDYMVRDRSDDQRDLVFVPVGINYDRVLEDRTLLLDLQPREERHTAPALSTTFRFVLRNLSLMARNQWHRFGYACVNFGRPLSLKEFMAGREVSFRSLPKQERFALVGELAAKLMREVGQVVPVVPVPLVAQVLLGARGRRLSALEIKAGVVELMGRLERRGAQVYIPRQDREYAVEVGLRMLTLRRLVVEEDGLFQIRPDEEALLRYYAHSIDHLLGDHDAAATTVPGGEAPRAP